MPIAAICCTSRPAVHWPKSRRPNSSRTSPVFSRPHSSERMAAGSPAPHRSLVVRQLDCQSRISAFRSRLGQPHLCDGTSRRRQHRHLAGQPGPDSQRRRPHRRELQVDWKLNRTTFGESTARARGRISRAEVRPGKTICDDPHGSHSEFSEVVDVTLKRALQSLTRRSRDSASDPGWRARTGAADGCRAPRPHRARRARVSCR